MLGFGVDEKELPDFWSEYQIDNKFIFEDTILELSEPRKLQLMQYGSTVAIQSHKQRGSNPQLMRVK